MKSIFGKSELKNEIEVTTTKEIYQTELEKQLKSDIEKLGFDVIEVKAEIDLEKGDIKKIYVAVEKSEKKKGENQINVNKVEIGKGQNDEKLSELDTQKIEEKLTQDYGINLKNIKINGK